MIPHPALPHRNDLAFEVLFEFVDGNGFREEHLALLVAHRSFHQPSLRPFPQPTSSKVVETGLQFSFVIHLAIGEDEIGGQRDATVGYFRRRAPGEEGKLKEGDFLLSATAAADSTGNKAELLGKMAYRLTPFLRNRSWASAVISLTSSASSA